MFPTNNLCNDYIYILFSVCSYTNGICYHLNVYSTCKPVTNCMYMYIGFAHVAVVGFLSRYLTGPLPYV